MAETAAGDESGGAMAGHVVVCGMGHVGYRVVCLLRQLGEAVTVVTLTSRDVWLRRARQMGVRVILGDARTPEHLLDAGIASARALIVATDHDLINVEIALDARRLRDDVPIVVRLFDQTLARQFEGHFDIQRAVDMSELAAPSFVAAALGARITGSFTLHDVPYLVARIPLDARSPLTGLTVREVQERYRLATLFRNPDGAPEETVPDSGTVLKDGDLITAVGCVFDWDRATPDPLIPRAPRHRRRFVDKVADYLHLPVWKPLLRQVWRHAPLAFRTALLFFGVVLGLSIVVFYFALDLSLIDSIYFMITTVTTTGYGDIHPGDAGPAVKLFAALVMLLGAATLATIYSIITDFLVTARFEQFLGRHRFPQSGHIIVVGLGNVGYRIVNELRRTGARVLAVDRNADGPFVSTVRAHTPVFIGDARVLETLHSVSVDSASAVIAVTDDDAVNLGIGLLAEEVNGKVHTVVRLFDADFAHKVEDDLSIDSALSASRIAAPTFAAAALHPRVGNAFVLEDRLFTVLSRTAGAEWAGQTPAEVRDAHGAILIARRSPDGAMSTDLGSVPLLRGEEVLAVIHQPLDPAHDE